MHEADPQTQLGDGLEWLCHEAHHQALARGEWSEISSALEATALLAADVADLVCAVRDGDPPSDTLPGCSEVEAVLATHLIALADLAGRLRIDLAGAVDKRLEAYRANPRH